MNRRNLLNLCLTPLILPLLKTGKIKKFDKEYYWLDIIDPRYYKFDDWDDVGYKKRKYTCGKKWNHFHDDKFVLEYRAKERNRFYIMDCYFENNKLQKLYVHSR